MTNFPGDFHDLSVITWRAYEFNNLLLSPPRFRRTLIVYFQLIMKFVTENWYWCLSRPSRVRWAAEKIVRKCSVPGVVFGSDQAEPQRTIPFFCWDRAAFFWQNGRAGIFKFKIVKRKKRRQRRKKGLCLCASLFRFWVTLLQDFMYIRQVPLPASCAYFLVKCGSSHPEGSTHRE